MEDSKDVQDLTNLDNFQSFLMWIFEGNFHVKDYHFYRTTDWAIGSGAN